MLLRISMVKVYEVEPVDTPLIVDAVNVKVKEPGR
jgi:hypothetical protein